MSAFPPDAPEVSVVICTYNRAANLPDAITAVLDQDHESFELVIVDDGSTDDTAATVEAVDDPRVRLVSRPNGGLGAARNTGLDAARGSIVIFVDDDDQPEPGWIRELSAPLADAGCAVSFCGVIDDGAAGGRIRLPFDLGPMFDHHVGLIAAGSFAVRRSVAIDVGGFDDQLACSHQTDFMLRVLPRCTETGATVAAVPEPLLRINWADASDRSRNDPARLLGCTERLIDHHEARLRRSPHAFANYAAVCGNCCARLARYGDARRWFLAAWRAERTTRHLLRAAAATLPPVARRVWRDEP